MQAKQLYIERKVLLEGRLEKVKRKEIEIERESDYRKTEKRIPKELCSSTSPRKNLNKNFPLFAIILY